MTVYCTERFKTEFSKLIKRNSYQNLRTEIIESFFNGSDDQISFGHRILGTDSRRLVKKRLVGSSDYRVYFYVYVTEKEIYLGYVYPKTGPEGKISLNNDFEMMIVNEIKNAIQRNEIYKLSVQGKELCFEWH